MFREPTCKVCEDSGAGQSGGDAPVQCGCQDHDNYVVHGTHVYQDGESWCYVLLENGHEIDGCEGFESEHDAREALAELINR